MLRHVMFYKCFNFSYIKILRPICKVTAIQEMQNLTNKGTNRIEVTKSVLHLEEYSLEINLGKLELTVNIISQLELGHIRRQATFTVKRIKISSRN